MGCGSSTQTVKQDPDNKPENKPTHDEKKEEDTKEEQVAEQEKKDSDINEKKNKFEQEVLEAHNNYRSKHGAPAMTLSRELCDISQKWADSLAENKKFEHSQKEDRQCGRGPTGENLFYSGSTGELDIKGSPAVDSWYAEIKDYEFGKTGFSMTTGHFTQVIWEQSTEMGVAYSIYKDGDWNKLVVVANYYPAGNMMGSFEENVKPAKDENKL